MDRSQAVQDTMDALLSVYLNESEGMDKDWNMASLINHLRFLMNIRN